MHHFDFLSLALDHSYSLKGTLLPLFVCVVELVSVLNGFGQALPLLSIKPRDANQHGAFWRVLRHGPICRGLTFWSAAGRHKLSHWRRANDPSAAPRVRPPQRCPTELFGRLHERTFSYF